MSVRGTFPNAGPSRRKPRRLNSCSCSADAQGMEILALDVALLAGALAAVRWASKAYARFAPLTAALVAGATFVLVRDHYDLEEMAFLGTLAVFCASAATVTAASSLALRQGRRTSAEYAAVAAALVPVLFGASLAVRYSLCLVTRCDLA